MFTSLFGLPGKTVLSVGYHNGEEKRGIPTSSFTANTVCQGLATEFTNNSSTQMGSIVANIWDFGDGGSSAALNPEYIYANSGQYSVKLTVIDSQGDVNEHTELITVHPSGTIDFVIGYNNQCESSTFTFTNLSNIVSGTIDSYEWDFGDGNTDNTINTQHTYASHGIYTITLSIITDNNCENSYSQPLEVFPEAVVDFTFQDACLGNQIQFNNNTTVAAGNLAYTWNFGDGNTSNEINPLHIYSTSGDYQISLEATTTEGCITSTVKQITIFPVPEVGFTVEDHCFGVDVQFTNTSAITQGVLFYTWDFGDGNSSNDDNPIHNYTTIGNYQVTLEATSDQGCVVSLSQYVYVSPKPIVNFTLNDICLGQEAGFFNNTTVAEGELSYLWDFGNGNTSQSINPTHEFSTYGIYNVKLKASTSQGGCADSLTQQIEVFQQPVATFEVKDNCLDSTIVFTNTSVFEGEEITYQWAFGDGSLSTNDNPTHQYTSPQTYTAILTAEAANGCSDTFSKPVKVYPVPVTDFIADGVCDNEAVEFRNLSAIPSGTISYAWQFGDGSASDESNPGYIYPQYGNYATILTTTSDLGCVAIKEKIVSVYPLPDTQFDAPPVCDAYPVTFQNNSSIANGEIISYQWDFGDQTNSIVKNPNKAYLNDGTYPVTLTAFSDRNCKQSIQKEITVNPPPVANFNVDDVCSTENIQLDNTSTISSGSLVYYWDFGDGFNTVSDSPVHTYQEYGVYNILLRVTSDKGCVDSLYRAVVIFAPPQVNAGEDITISQGYSTRLNAYGDGETYRWEPIIGLNNSSISDPLASPLTTTEYVAYNTDSYGCENTDTVTVYVENDFRLVATNVITPDGNGQNDTWVIENIETFGDAHVRVFDRWGKAVFEQQGYKNDWSGLAGEDILPDGDYYYYISFEGSEKEYKGTLTIIRNKN